MGICHEAMINSLSANNKAFFSIFFLPLSTHIMVQITYNVRSDTSHTDPPSVRARRLSPDKSALSPPPPLAASSQKRKQIIESILCAIPVTPVYKSSIPLQVS
ncbi:hypothetical protein GWI33_001859 [Rhynchophorus ferrugineus]|uniref:Uncharacterized protein n=1 Tax=Rhynchophorus ferrugineus TaxID=354439 RepID=A0A834HMY2_RHYFE|nr:hypothetical protein GWI33_001859 [Rhynchophorus ferrugineus]